MEVYFRVNSDSKIGSGHFMRCNSIAESLQVPKKKISFISEKLPISKIQFIKKKGFNYEEIKKNDLNLDEKKILKLIKNKKKSILFADDYKFTKKWYKTIKKKINELIIINDFDKKLKKIIHINPSIIKSDIKNKVYGLPIVNKKFNIKNYTERFKSIKKNKIILVSFGASDNENCTKKIIDLINCKLFYNYKIYIIIGEFYKFEKNLYDSIKNKKNIKIYKNITNLKKLFLKTKFAITSAGVISRELINFGIPSIIFKISKNQNKNFQFYKKYKIFDIFENKNFSRINKKKFNNLLLKKINNFNLKNYLNIISNIQPDTLAKINYVSLKPKIKLLKLKNVSEKDLIFLFKLANQNKRRKFAFNNKKISIANHYLWFKKKIKSKYSKIFILWANNNMRIGQIRFDWKKNDAYIDYSIDEFFYNQGFGKKLIEIGINKMRKKYKNIYAKVLKNNKPSNKIFKNCEVNILKKYNLYKIV